MAANVRRASPSTTSSRGEEPIRVNPVHGTWLTELTRDFDITWRTGWNEGANRFLAPLPGIPGFPVLTMPEAPFHPSAKVALIAEFAQRRPAVWIDDVHTAEALDWSSSRTVPTLLIPVSPAIGLTRGAVDLALAWSRNL
jgi:hypothetical protein